MESKADGEKKEGCKVGTVKVGIQSLLPWQHTSANRNYSNRVRFPYSRRYVHGPKLKCCHTAAFLDLIHNSPTCLLIHYPKVH